MVDHLQKYFALIIDLLLLVVFFSFYLSVFIYLAFLEEIPLQISFECCCSGGAVVVDDFTVVINMICFDYSFLSENNQMSFIYSFLSIFRTNRSMLSTFLDFGLTYHKSSHFILDRNCREIKFSL